MTLSAIAAAESRVTRSRADLDNRMHRLGLALARPAPLAGAAIAGALVAFAAVRLRPNAPLRALAAVFRHGFTRYVRWRTALAATPAEHTPHA